MRVFKLVAPKGDLDLQEDPTLLLICKALDFPLKTWIDVLVKFRISFVGHVPRHSLHHCDLVTSLELVGRNFRF